MKRWLLLLLSILVLASCHRTTCPAYMNGAATGTQGSGEKKRTLFPEKMKKKKMMKKAKPNTPPKQKYD
ncbi:MAG TPA: hypothetical protein VE978_06035 [Chitinophagales bacterium]|nr:hypothetical protein [Chitinophagales bacterium]